MSGPDNPHVIAFSGVLDSEQLPTVKRAFEGVSDGVIIDLRDVRSIDSAILLELTRLRNRIGPRVVLVVARTVVWSTLDAMGFTRIFKTTTRIADARTIFRRDYDDAFIVRPHQINAQSRGKLGGSHAE